MPVLTTGQAARACRVTIPTVKRWILEGHLTAFRTAGGHYRVAEAELDRFRLDRHLRGSSHEFPKVLIIDDEPAVLAVLTDALTWAGRYKVESAQDGYEGLIRVGSFQPDVLVLDLRMPGLDGFQVCRRIKTDPLTRLTKILAISGYVEGDTVTRVFAAGADAFLEKPLDAKRLQAELDRLVGIPPATSSVLAGDTASDGAAGSAPPAPRTGRRRRS
jgi:excisionase family DNA binding protein